MRKSQADSSTEIADIVPVQPLGQEHISRRKVSADPTEEYVASGDWAYSHSASFLRSLPFYIDDISLEFGDDIYERMSLDPQIASDLHTLKLSILAQGMTLQTSVSDKAAPGYRKASQIRDFCQSVLDSLDTPIIQVLYEMLDAMAYGSKVAEMVYDFPASGELKNYLVVRSIKPKPRRTIAYVVDAFNNIRFLLGRVPGVYSPMLADSVIISPLMPNAVPRSKVAILTWDKENGDPRGSSILRPAYNSWWLKQQNFPEYLRYLAMFAVPGLVGFTAENADEDTLRDADGNEQYDADGFPIRIRPEQAMVAALVKFRNGTAMAFPHGSDVKPLEVKDGASPYEGFIEARNREISRVITGQTLSSMEGQHQSRAAADTHADARGLRVAYGKELLENMVRQDILRPMVSLNFGAEDAAMYTPKPALSDTEPQDFKENATAIASLWNSGYVSPSQLRGMDAKLGLPPRTDEEMESITEQKLNPPEPPGPQDSESEDITGVGKEG